MRIEIMAGGMSSVSSLQSGLYSLHSDINSTIDSLKGIQRKLTNISGGTGNLSDALDNVKQRITTEQAKLYKVEQVSQKTTSFLSKVVTTDARVASLVSQNREKFFNQYSWLRPVVEEEKSWWEQRVDDLKEFFGNVGETLKQVFNSVVDFVKEHAVEIISTILIVVGAVLAVAAVIATGGLALVPILSALGCSAMVATAISTTVAVVAVLSTVAASTMNIVDTWAKIDNPTFNAWQFGLNIVSAVTNLAYSIGGIYNTVKGINIVKFDKKWVITDKNTFDPYFVDAQGDTNLMRMRKGLAPIGPDGKSVNIHHFNQTEKGFVYEMTENYHKTNYAKLHHNTGQFPSKINRYAFNKWRTEYWKWRSLRIK